ncbi:hypothetical protein P3T73_09810 [Kiritimatiellota bacterium B12222]|nr:hypothetical protein P3T73_09810 [Kiritimatiellota bacterium B12222]
MTAPEKMTAIKKHKAVVDLECQPEKWEKAIRIFEEATRVVLDNEVNEKLIQHITGQAIKEYSPHGESGMQTLLDSLAELSISELNTDHTQLYITEDAVGGSGSTMESNIGAIKAARGCLIGAASLAGTMAGDDPELTEKLFRHLQDAEYECERIIRKAEAGKSITIELTREEADALEARAMASEKTPGVQLREDALRHKALSQVEA